MIPHLMITLDKPRRLRFSMSACVQFEQLTEYSLSNLDDAITTDICMKLLWVMLRQDEPDITLPQTLALVDEHCDNLYDIMKSVGSAVRLAFKVGDTSPNAVPVESR